MRNRIGTETKRKFRDRIRDVVKGLSRKVLVYRQPIKSECPNCYYDKLTDRSTGKCRWTPAEAVVKQSEWELLNPQDPCVAKVYRYKYFVKGRCPVCFGDGFLETKRRRWIDALVIWDPSQIGSDNKMIYTPAGTEGSTIVELKTDPKYFDLFKNCENIVVDGIECRLSRPPILRGLGNQSILVITASSIESSVVVVNSIVFVVSSLAT